MKESGAVSNVDAYIVSQIMRCVQDVKGKYTA